MSRSRSIVIGCLGLLVAAGGIRLLAADSYSFASGWRTREIRIDGSDEEWRPILEPVKKQHFSIAFLNDDEALYFCLVTTDRNAVRQIGTVGLTLWLDAAGSAKKKSFGVRYRSADQSRVDVLGPGKEVRVVDNGSSGIVARMGGGPGVLVYELKIPLRKTVNTREAPDVDAGAAVQVTLETPEWRGPLPPAGRGGPVQIGVGVAGPHGGVFYPGPDTTLLKPIEVAGGLRLAQAPQTPGR